MVKAGEIQIDVRANTKEFSRGMKQSESSVRRFAKVAVAALATIGIARFFRSAVQEAIIFENAMKGLSSVSRNLGVDMNDARMAANALASDGLLLVNEAAEGLKNLLATGFELPQAIDLMNTFRDAAAFNRQGTLDFGAAIIGATQGIKNQNSIMVDNVGITKNLSIIMKEAGMTLMDLSDETNKASALQALYNGLMKEGSLFTGDAAAAAETAQGAFAKWNTAVRDLKIGFAQEFMPVLGDFMTFLTENEELMNSVRISLEITAKAVVVILGSVLTNLAMAFNLIREFRAEFPGGLSEALGFDETQRVSLSGPGVSRIGSVFGRAAQQTEQQMRGLDIFGMTVDIMATNVESVDVNTNALNDNTAALNESRGGGSSTIIGSRGRTRAEAMASADVVVSSQYNS